MIKKRTLLPLVIGFFLAFCWTYQTFTRPSEEQRIQRLLQDMVRATERRELSKLLSYVADGYQDDMGFDRASLARVGNEVFKTYQKISARLVDLSIEVKGEEAKARFIAVVLASQQKGEKGEDLLVERGSDHFLVTLQKFGNAWKIIRTEIPPSTID